MKRKDMRKYGKRRQFIRCCHKAKTVEQVVRLWNWIDHKLDPEWYWSELEKHCSFAYNK